MRDFDGFKYAVIENFLGHTLCQTIFEYAVLKESTNQLMVPDRRIPQAARMYGDPLTEVVLEHQRGSVTSLVGAELYPTYSYLRVHRNGAAMEAHTDREACEIGVTINVGGDPWPIWIRPADDDIRVDLAVGDAMIYKGREIPHWRQPFSGSLQAQVMLFYVRQSGAFASYKFDKRKALGLPFATDSTAARTPPLTDKSKAAIDHDNAASLPAVPNV